MWTFCLEPAWESLIYLGKAPCGLFFFSAILLARLIFSSIPDLVFFNELVFPDNQGRCYGDAYRGA